MKTITTFLLCALCIFTGFAQTDSNGSGMNIPERTPQLQALYQQAKQLENTGTAAEINANRLAIKDAWQQVNPSVAELYKPLEKPIISGHTLVDLEINSQQSQPLSRSPEDWDTDLMVHDGYIDGQDMEVTADGDIYIAAYETTGAGPDSSFYLYRSTNNGNTFELWQSGNTISEYEKTEIISIDGDGENYLIAYSLFDDGVLAASRWNMATGDYDWQMINVDVKDFSVDRNYPSATSNQRVFATYIKDSGACSSGGEVFSARSTAGSYGFDWVDETLLGTCAKKIAFTYGTDGSSYTTYIGTLSGNLYARANSNFNDPASWTAEETVMDGSINESKFPNIRAARKPIATDEVLIFVSSRDAGSTDNEIGQAYRRENGSPYTPLDYVNQGPDNNIFYIDSWIRRVNDVETIQTSFNLSNYPDQISDNYSKQYNGTDFEDSEVITDTGLNVFHSISAIAETADQLPCVAFGASRDNMVDMGVYFDRKSTLGVDENNLDGLTFYPNPAQDVINISAKSTVENITIYSLLGQEVMQLSPEQKSPSINISSLATGVYVMKVEVNGQIGTYKIIKE